MIDAAVLRTLQAEHPSWRIADYAAALQTNRTAVWYAMVESGIPTPPRMNVPRGGPRSRHPELRER